MQRQLPTLAQLAENTLNNPGYNLFAIELHKVLSLHGGVDDEAFYNAIFDFYANKAHSEDDKKMAKIVAKLLIKAIKNRESLLEKWPDINTLEALIAAQQKITYLHCIEQKVNQFEEKDSQNTHFISGFNDIYEDFKNQLLGSDFSVTLEKLLSEDSLFLKTPVKRPGKETKTLTIREKVGRKEILTKVERNVLDPVMVVQSFRPEPIQKEATIKDFLRTVTQGKFIPETCILDPNLVIRSKIDLLEKDCHKECLNLHNALIEMRQKYLARGRKTHCKDIDNLINHVAEIINENSMEDYYTRHGKIMAAIRKAYQVQECQFMNPLYFSYFKKPDGAFETRLSNHNDKEFWYPRLLKEILDNDKSVDDLSIKKRKAFIRPAKN